MSAPLAGKRQDANNGTALLSVNCAVKTVILHEDEQELMRAVSKVIWEGDEIFVSDGYGVFTFDSDGSFIRVLRNLGRGPGEYRQVFDFSVDDNSIYILDSNRKLLKYTRQGDFLNDVDLDDFYASMSLGGGQLYLVSGNQKPGERIHVHDAVSLKEKTSFWDIPESYISYRHFMGSLSIFEGKDGLLFHEPLSNVVFIVGKNSVKPYLSFDFYGTSAQQSFWNGAFLDVMDAFEKLKQSGYSAGLPHFAYDGNTILYHFTTDEGRRLMGLWSESGKKQIQFDTISLPNGESVLIDRLGKFFYGYDDMLLAVEDDMGQTTILKIRLK